MANVFENINLRVKGGTQYQKVDGFGVNINSKYWDEGRLIPVMDLLLDDLGATLYRVDIYGKSDWVDPDNTKDVSVLNEKTYSEVYSSEVFRNGWAMMKYLNDKGIEPYLTCSGDVPKWMLGADEKTLVQYEQFCDMLVSLIEWAKNKEHIHFKYFGPLNETDIGSPEGPTLLPEGYAQVLQILDRKLKEKGLDEIRLVVAEQSDFNADYVKKFVQYKELAGRIGVFGLHTYGDLSCDRYKEITEAIKDTPFKSHSIWMSEYGDLDQTGEKEWCIAWKSTSRLLDTLKAGFSGALVWDAYDNYHDHDGAWTIYGLFRSARKIYTPKKRYYAAKQIFKYVLPGFERVDVDVECKDIKVLAFANQDRTEFTLVGMNISSKDVYATAWLDKFAENIKHCKVSHFRTSENENCYKVEDADFRSTINANTYEGLKVHIPAYCIFTLTNIV